MLHSHVRKNRLFHRGHIRSVTVWQHYLCTVCVCGWVVKWGQYCSALTCGPVYAAVLSILSVSAWLTGVRLVIAIQAAVGEMFGDSERWRQWRRGMARESVTQAFLFYDTHPQPRIVYQYQQMTDKGTAQLQTDTHRDCVYACACVCVCVFELSWMNAGVDALKTMACPHFARSAYPHILAVMMRPCSMCTKHQTTVPAAFPLPSPLCTCFSLTIKMLTAFQKLDFTNGKTASAFLQLHIWQP